MAAKKKTEVMEQTDSPAEGTIQLNRPEVEALTLSIQGLSSLVMHKFSEKSKQTMADKQQKKAAQPKEAKNPKQLYQAAMHVLPGSKASDKKPKLGFPASAFRKAMIKAYTYVGVKRYQVQGCVFVVAPDPGCDLVPIEYEKVQMREDTVVIGGFGSRTTDLRYRPELINWRAVLEIHYDSQVLTVEQIVNLVDRAGFSVGIGENRPEKGGDWGRFMVDVEASHLGTAKAA